MLAQAGLMVRAYRLLALERRRRPALRAWRQPRVAARRRRARRRERDRRRRRRGSTCTATRRPPRTRHHHVDGCAIALVTGLVAGHRLFAALLVAAAACASSSSSPTGRRSSSTATRSPIWPTPPELQPESIRPARLPRLPAGRALGPRPRVVPAVQHLLGLATGSLVYALCAASASAGGGPHRGGAGAVRRLPAEHRAAHPVGGPLLAACRSRRSPCSSGGVGPSLAACAARVSCSPLAALTRSVGLALIAPGARVRALARLGRCGRSRSQRPSRSRWPRTRPGTARRPTAPSRSPTTTATSCTGAWPTSRAAPACGSADQAARPVRPAAAVRAPEPELLRLAPVVGAALSGLPADASEPKRPARILRARRDPPPAARLRAHRARRHGALRRVPPLDRAARRAARRVAVPRHPRADAARGAARGGRGGQVGWLAARVDDRAAALSDYQRVDLHAGTAARGGAPGRGARRRGRDRGRSRPGACCVPRCSRLRRRAWCCP